MKWKHTYRRQTGVMCAFVGMTYDQGREDVSKE